MVLVKVADGGRLSIPARSLSDGSSAKSNEQEAARMTSEGQVRMPWRQSDLTAGGKFRNVESRYEKKMKMRKQDQRA